MRLPGYSRIGLGFFAAAALIAAVAATAQSRRTPEQLAAMSRAAETKGLAEPFRGVTTNGTPQPGLFPIRSTGVSTEPVRLAANAFLANLDAAQRDKATFPVDDDEWRKWMNQSFYVRQGVSFEEMTPKQRDAALALMRASLSAKGLQLSEDIMKLNHTLGELNGDNFEEYDEGLYWITVMGEPSAKEPWGWQVDGHHLIVNYFVLGDQVVMTPLFVGSEPVTATSGKYKGLTVLQQERAEGLRMLEALTPEQKKQAIIETSKAGSSNLGEAFKDNLVLDYAGVPVRSLSAQQKALLTSLIGLFVGNMDDGHAKVRMDEVNARLDDTYFAWIGPTGADSAFYYRIHSPVILIEFDQQPPVNLRHLATSQAPTRDHIHAVVRTPNGNDYGKDLLRQHYATVKH
jgi:hypothetical protein